MEKLSQDYFEAVTAPRGAFVLPFID